MPLLPCQRTRLLFLFYIGYLLLPLNAFAQRDLANARTTSYYTYLYKLSDGEARQLYEKGMQTVRQSFFHTKVDSFPTHQPYAKRLPQGHYLYTHTSGPDLEYSLTSVVHTQLQLLKNHVDLAVVLYDTLGNNIPDAQVKIRNRKIPFDAASQSYRLAGHKRSGLLSVTQAGFTFYVPLDPENKKLTYALPLWEKVLFRRPVSYLWSPFRDVVQTLKYHEPQGWIRSAFSIFEEDYRPYDWEDKRQQRGYLALNKPLYRPNDTVHYKTFVVKRNGQPYKKPLTAKIYVNYKPKKIGQLQPYRPGAYEGFLVLHDSLKIRLDTQVSLDLVREKKSDDKEIISTSFRYEDYELKENTYTLRLEREEHFLGTTNQVILRGADANGLTLPDARVELTVLTKQVSQSQNAVQFIPDTLWVHRQALENTGETIIPLPASIFPKARVDYQVKAVFLNSSNERAEKQVRGSYSFEEGHFQLTLKNDSVLAQYLEGEQSKPQQATLVLYNGKNEKFQTQQVQLPALLPLQPYARTYELSNGKRSASLSLPQESANLQFFSERTADSLFLSLQNPRRLPFWYFIYRNNQLVERGQDTTALWSYSRRVPPGEPYYASVQYIWGGQVKSEEYNIPFRKSELAIAVQAPATVYPGQQTNLTLEVKDAKGKPAANVDLTAYALTSKFKNAAAPSVPSFGLYRSRKSNRTFKVANGPDKGRQLLQWNSWRQAMGLDSLAYYQLLYPQKGLFANYAPAADSLTQIAPFVVDSGRVVPVHLIYLNEVPVYFSGTDVVPPYSFPTDSGYHHLKLRTARHLIILDSVYLKQGQKLILSVDQNQMPHLLKEAAKGHFSEAEQGNLAQYLVPVEQSFTQGLSYLRQGPVVQALPNARQARPSFDNTRHDEVLAGPFRPSLMEFVSLGSFRISFTPEAHFTHHFSPGLLKMREKQTFKGKYSLFDKATPYVLSNSTLAATALTEASLLTQWKDTQYQYWLTRVLNQPEPRTEPGFGRLQWHLDTTIQKSPQFVFLYPPKAATQQVLMYRGSQTLLHQIAPGQYKLVLLFADHSHLSTLVTMKPNGVLRLYLSKAQLQQASSETRALEKYLQNSVERLLRNDPNAVSFLNPAPSSGNSSPSVSYGGSANFHNHVRGRVLDKGTDEALPAVTVQVKGTNVAVATDVEGYFAIDAPANGILVFSFIGYVHQEVPVRGSSRLEVKLPADARQLQEVVVTGFGTQSRSNLTGAVATVLQGKVAGVRIRGASSIQGNTQPLIIVDGMPFSGNLADLEANAIASSTTLKAAEATALYGAAAANGVVIITTKKGQAEAAQQPLLAGAETDAAASIRSYFSDYAFWQPRLVTDKQGKVTFPVTFPGDVTSWKAHVLAMDGNRRSGQASTEIRSFKAMMATLSGPRFLIEGDQTQIIGKAVNYLPDTASVQTRFAFNGKALREQNLKLGRVYTDTVLVQAPTVAPDSVELLFSLRQGSGFSDGERRHICVYKKGVLERKGQFLSLPVDTTFTLTFDPAKGPVRFYAQSDLLQVMLDEIKALHRYEYWCNEQAASKLKGLLWEKRIQAVLGKPFEHDRMVRRLVRHLEKTQKQDGTWSWWENGPAYLWITHHVTEALVMARQEGYSTSFKKEPLIAFLTFHVEKKDTPDKIRALEILQKLEANVDFPAYMAKLEKQPNPALEDQLRLTRLRQKLQLPAPLDTLQHYRRTTTLGGLHWGEDKFSLFDNHISNTLLAYEILKASGGHERDLVKIQAFLLNERRTGYWRNTYESARILETLLPDLVKEKGQTAENRLFLTAGGVNTTLKKFPVDTTFTSTQPLTIQKQGSLALYLTAYQNEWIAQPARVDKDFVVRTSFAHTKQAKATLTAGKPVEMEVEIEVKADASYVMIEVPIPAGCTYDTKASWGRHEAHREYFRHKVSIFSNHLSKGKYTFTIQLLPRYKGTYTLNPAKAELMYFPTFFGREGVKEVDVK
ncbi:carboxypeptidase-like regulatory domain-containing protein [Rufibacter glacialis]|uniref:Carboxypeptidase-like regulatory domain-containing protein n=1 Tax=Rufibacter glacialis TaxID=1259555 RepID=A0A5M8QL08_9BACT|nr:alpha-2-macroglobulin family protein [Rufibacter glacialis]KAA6435343.1 TonB-dependent receptor plug domain-containing protein [Rufibacter glacialis]GGK62539.1 hypothetical protein GCM10011405_08290 [Rufibacter glacialis]